MGALLRDTRYALRMLAKSPGFAAVAIFTLALGIGANTVIFEMVHNILLRQLPYQHAENLVQIWNTYPAWGQIPLSAGDYRDFQQNARDFVGMAAYVDVAVGFNMTGDGDPERLQAAFASSELFPMLGIRPAAGRTFTPEEDKSGSGPAAMISRKLWESHFG
jgi:putative ABC transport system permease protein